MGRGTLAGLLALALLTAASCGGGSGESGAAPPGETVAEVNGQPLTEAELRYGQAPVPDDAVTYQPDVVLLPAGADAVVSVTADGVTWTIDGDAEGADRLEPGAVLFATSRGVGRIVDVRPAGDDLAVTLAPVELTEVIRDGTFRGDAPIDLGGAAAYLGEGGMWAEDAPAGAELEPAPEQTAIVRSSHVRSQGGAPPRVEQPRPVVGAPRPVSTRGFRVTPMCCHGGVGAHLTYDDGGIRFAGTVTLVMEKPSARFHLEISGGRIRVAELAVHGAGGVRLDLTAASAVGTDRQLDKTFPIPIDFSVPVGHVLGLPFTLTARQEIQITTAFSAKNGNISARGEYVIGGELGFGYRGGSWGVHLPTAPAMRSSLLDSIDGINVGVQGIVLAFKTTFTIGIGAFGFMTGLNAGLVVSAGVTVGSDLADFAPLKPVEGTKLKCRGATLAVDATYSVGYTVPAFVASVINFFMKPLGVRPIQRSGGIPSPPGRAHITDLSQYEPRGCRG
ncbi:hypothetical protein [Jiangella endophytica]|uniref:hypothetical protein n=1 Tax=Jiangella endophytica TaxID=1623398 RepID=UPI000E34F747|nr:hypothetical protein [Jiangella endophytica]